MTSNINPLAKHGYQDSTDAYERGRPDFPSEAVACLVEHCKIGQGSKVIDIGAGTGKFTRLLVPTKATLRAIEPVEGMRKKFAALLPDVEVLEGSAEFMPVHEGWADAIVAAQAFHWFDGPSALQECHRLLKVDGMLGMIWNSRDESVDWVAELTRIIDVHEHNAPRYKTMEWEKAFRSTKLFQPLSKKSFTHAHKGTVQTVVDRVASISFIGALEDKTRMEVLAQVRSLVENHPSTKGLENIEMPYRTDVYWCQRA
ncbi:MAG: class I SAM-dependent methyltransferase [candidate division FCPU426 bacterium]